MSEKKLNKKLESTTAYKIDDNYTFIKTNKNSIIYENNTKNYCIFEVKEDIPESMLNNFKFNDLTKAILYKSEKIPLNNIDNDTIKIIEDTPQKPNIIYDYSGKDKILIDIKIKLEEYYKIKVNKDNTAQKYYYNHHNKRYELLDELKLGQLIEQDLNKPLLQNDVVKIYKMFRNVEEPNNDAITFNNCVLDTNTFTKLPLTTFTIKNIPYDFLEPKERKNLGKPTLIEKTIKEITIPANKPNYTKHYDYFLEVLGSSFQRINYKKYFVIFTGSGDDGKDILQEIIKIIHGTLALDIEPSQLVEDEFFKLNLSGCNCYLMNELHKNSFTPPIVEMIKKMTGRGRASGRGMYTTKLSPIEDFGVIIITTNTIPSVPFNNEQYWRRLIIIKLPNKFYEDEEPNPTENIYKANPFLSDELRKDKDGIEWLISIAIEKFKPILNNEKNFTIKQSITDTQFIYDGTNPLRNFLERHLIRTDNIEDKVSNKEIVYHFLNWCIKHGISPEQLQIDNINELRKEIGNKIKNIHKISDLNNFKGRKGSSTAYKTFALYLDEDMETLEDIERELPTLISTFFN